ncbi:hypothetical protein BD413DRAFT_65655 [Trametes elegans]|nr:hypothetical protein BD413DRAFT_65655 [Trametes elegans]
MPEPSTVKFSRGAFPMKKPLTGTHGIAHVADSHRCKNALAPPGAPSTQLAAARPSLPHGCAPAASSCSTVHGQKRPQRPSSEVAHKCAWRSTSSRRMAGPRPAHSTLRHTRRPITTHRTGSPSTAAWRPLLRGRTCGLATTGTQRAPAPHAIISRRRRRMTG